MTQITYLDNSATTPVANEVLEAMLPYFADQYANASSLHTPGHKARQAIETSRQQVADLLQVASNEVVFTSGATEANNLAIKGIALANQGHGHIITSKIEHHAVLHSCRWLEKQGIKVTYLDVDKWGRVDPQQLKQEIRDNTFLVSIMAGNNEIGTLQPIERIGQICHEHSIPFHTDAVQAFGKISLPMNHIDLMSISAHKLHGPKGVGFLFVRKGTKLNAIIHGGGHEHGLRSGTENTPGIIGLATASQLAFAEQDVTTSRMRKFQNRLIGGISDIPGSRLNGHRQDTLPHIVNFSFQAIEGESLIMRLDEHGIAVNTGSACSSPNLEPSHVLMAIGVPMSMAHGSLRVSTGRQTTSEEVDRLLEVLPKVIADLRAISPFKVGEEDV